MRAKKAAGSILKKPRIAWRFKARPFRDQWIILIRTVTTVCFSTTNYYIMLTHTVWCAPQPANIPVFAKPTRALQTNKPMAQYEVLSEDKMYVPAAAFGENRGVLHHRESAA